MPRKRSGRRSGSAPGAAPELTQTGSSVLLDADLMLVVMQHRAIHVGRRPCRNAGEDLSRGRVFHFDDAAVLRLFPCPANQHSLGRQTDFMPRLAMKSGENG